MIKIKLKPALIVIFIFFLISLCIITTLYSAVSPGSAVSPPGSSSSSSSTNQKQEDLQYVNPIILDTVLKRIDDTIVLFGYLITAIVTLFGVGVGLLQFLQMKDAKTTIEEKFKLETMLIKNKTEELIEWEVKKVFSKNSNLIFEYVKSYCEEVLLMTPEAKGLLLSRLRIMDLQLKQTLESHLKKEIADEFYEIIANSIEDWHTLSQIFSTDSQQIQTGLLTFSSKPFYEAEDYLIKLKKKYRSDPELLLAVNDALKSLYRSASLK